jgi:SAM-dependent methyltransferase
VGWLQLRDRTDWVWNHLPDTQRLLEVGCWDALGTATWAPKCQHLYGIDVAEAVHQGPAIVIRAQASAAALPFASGTFDTVVFSEVLEHLPPELERPTLEEIRRVLTADGRLLLTTPHKGWFAWLDPMDARRRLGLAHPGHRHYTRGQLESLLAGLFRIDVFERSGFLLYPLSVALGFGNNQNKVLLRIRQLLSEREYRRDFGDASYNLMLVATPV